MAGWIVSSVRHDKTLAEFGWTAVKRDKRTSYALCTLALLWLPWAIVGQVLGQQVEAERSPPLSRGVRPDSTLVAQQETPPECIRAAVAEGLIVAVGGFLVSRLVYHHFGMRNQSEGRTSLPPCSLLLPVQRGLSGARASV